MSEQNKSARALTAKALSALASSTLRLRAANFGASFLFATLSFTGYLSSPHAKGMLHSSWSEDSTVTGATMLSAAYAIFCLSLLLVFALENTPLESKSVAALRAITRVLTRPIRVAKEGLPTFERVGLLSVLLKAFFAPLMLLSLFGWTKNLVANGTYIFNHLSSVQSDFIQIFNSHGYWFLFEVIIFVDVAFFTVGYLVEHPWLKNEIRSVDPTWLGWAVTLACYPPMNAVTNALLGGSASEFPQFEHPAIHVTVNTLILILMAIYASASVALNLRASNLTHRGIIAHGPYRFIRHPAYACKNAAWWLGSIPVISSAWSESLWAALLAVAATAAWTGLYALRALTEEDHLRSVDREYDAYCQKVRYRFIPGLV